MPTKEETHQEFEDHDSESLHGDEREGLMSGTLRQAGRKKVTINARFILVALIISIGLNFAQLIYVSVHQPQFYSLYARIPEREKDVTFWYNTEYTEGPEEDQNALWDAIDYSDGIVAIHKDEADARGIPRSMTFPWDVDKGIYIIHGYHVLHCVALVRTYAYDYYKGRKPYVSWHHMEHCLDLIRQDIMCAADDNMDRAKDHGDQFFIADNQTKKCRDWDKLEKYAKDHSACFKTINITRSGQDFGVEHQLDRYTFCPEGSPYIPLVNAWKDMVRPNQGNIEDGVSDEKSDEEKKAMAEAVVQHNKAIMDGS